MYDEGIKEIVSHQIKPRAACSSSSSSAASKTVHLPCHLRNGGLWCCALAIRRLPRHDPSTQPSKFTFGKEIASVDAHTHSNACGRNICSSNAPRCDNYNYFMNSKEFVREYLRRMLSNCELQRSFLFRFINSTSDSPISFAFVDIIWHLIF